MHRTLLAALFSLVLGVGIGVLIRPAPPRTTTVPSTDPTGRPASSTAAGTSAPRTAAAHSTKSNRRPASPAPEGFDPDHLRQQDANEGMLAAIKNGQDTALAHLKRSHEAQFESLSTLLSLTEDQRNELRQNYLDPLLAQIQQWSATDDPTTISPSLPPDLGEALANILTAEQVETYNAHRADTQRRRAQATALRQVADLAFLDLTPDQRDAAYDVLCDEERTRNPRSPLNQVLGAQTVQQIYTWNPAIAAGPSTQQGAIIAIVDPSSSGRSSAYPPSAFSPLAQRAREVAIELNAARFEDILTAEQLAAYREHLTRVSDPSRNPFPFDGQLPPLKP